MNKDGTVIKIINERAKLLISNLYSFPWEGGFRNDYCLGISGWALLSSEQNDEVCDATMPIVVLQLAK